MKIRMGFVPNSSSSSFILVLPKKPKTERELYAMIFGDRPENGMVYDYSEGVTCLDAIKVLFVDIHRKDSRATFKKLLEQLQGRYSFIASTWDNSDGFYQKSYGDFCWGTDSELVEKIRQLNYEEDISSEKNREAIKNFFDSRIPPVPYASNYKDEHGKRIYTPQQVRAYNAYAKKTQALRETEEYRKLDKNGLIHTKKFWKKIQKLSRQAAKKDMEALLERTKTMFLAVLSYSDNDGCQGAAMEHGDIWKNVEHVRVSHH